MRHMRWILLACALFSFAAPADAQKGRSSTRSSSASSNKHLSGGTGSSHKGGHYTPSRSAPSGSYAPGRERSLSTTPAVKSPSLSERSRPGMRSLAPGAQSLNGSRTPRALAESPAPQARDKKGRFVRSRTAKESFLKSTGHPHGWPGHVVDHKIPLACGGADSPSNMQWQRTAEAKAKDKTERRGCGKGR
jgi:hypothetical protein